MKHLREKVICVIREFDFRGDGEKICPYHNPYVCLTESIIMCLYTRVQFTFPSICSGGDGETPHFAKIGIYYHTW